MKQYNMINETNHFLNYYFCKCKKKSNKELRKKLNADIQNLIQSLNFSWHLYTDTMVTENINCITVKKGVEPKPPDAHIKKYLQRYYLITSFKHCKEPFVLQVKKDFFCKWNEILAWD